MNSDAPQTPALASIQVPAEPDVPSQMEADWIDALVQAQACRAAGVLVGERAIFFTTRALVGITESRSTTENSPAVAQLGERINVYKATIGMPPEDYWTWGEEPDEIKDVCAAFWRQINVLIAATAREFGEHQIAEMLLHRPKELDELCDRAKLRETLRMHDEAGPQFSGKVH